MFRLSIVACSLVLIMTTSALASSTEVVFPRPPVEIDARASYAQSVIELALSKTTEEYGEAHFRYSDTPMERKRMELSVEQGDFANVLMVPGSNDFDERYILVPIPIDRGLLGYRVSLIHKESRNRFEGVKTLEALRRNRACLGEHWKITRIFEHNDLPVITDPQFKSLFRLLNHQRCEYFSRGIGEIIVEIDHWTREYPDLAVEPHVVLRTPQAFYLYVSRKHPQVAERLLMGLERAIEDKSFHALFQKRFSGDFETLGLSRRTTINLTPLEVHTKAPLDRPELWYRP